MSADGAHAGNALDLNWLRKYSQAGPRYTSYPTAPNFSDSYGERDAIAALEAPDASGKPLSLYFHLPFCESVCYFCACSVIFTKKRDRAAPYLQRVYREMDLLRPHLARGRKVRQLHFGGGTPTFLSPDLLRELNREIRKRFEFEPDAEISIEVDPRETTEEHVAVLAEAGFNRASLGVQDVEPQVQKAVHRVQPVEVTEQTIAWLRKYGFKGINIDLIYGLPLQTVASYRATVAEAIRLGPDRVALFNFAYLPWLKTHQRRIDKDACPTTEEKLEIFAQATEAFTNAGYRYVGMDHFARPDDELCRAQDDGTLHRNFQGYSTKGGCDLVGIGVTAISEVGGDYAQNVKEEGPYFQAIDAGRLPTQRGLHLTADDLIRKEVISDLICHFRLDKKRIETDFGVDFDSYFAGSRAGLAPFIEDGLVSESSNSIEISDAGRYVIRNICMTFDAHLEQNVAKGQKFSQTV